jgi:hypothetical protein
VIPEWPGTTQDAPGRPERPKVNACATPRGRDASEHARRSPLSAPWLRLARVRQGRQPVEPVQTCRVAKVSQATLYDSLYNRAPWHVHRYAVQRGECAIGECHPRPSNPATGRTGMVPSVPRPGVSAGLLSCQDRVGTQGRPPHVGPAEALTRARRTHSEATDQLGDRSLSGGTRSRALLPSENVARRTDQQRSPMCESGAL